MIGGKRTSGPSPGGRDQKKNLDWSVRVFSQVGDDFFFVFGSGSRTRRGSRPRSSNHCVCDGVYAHTHLHASASSCRAFPTPRVRAKRTLHEDEQSGYLAKSVSNTGDESREFDKNTSVDDTTPIIDPDHNISDFSKTASENTRQFGVSTVVESSVLHVSHWWFCSSERKQGKHAIGKPLQDREREKVLWSMLQSRYQGKVDGTVLGVILYRLTKNSLLMNEISEDILNEELNNIFLVKIQFRANVSPLSTTKFWNDEIQNTHNSSHNVSFNLKDYNNWNIFNGQIKLSVREYIWVVNWRWENVFTRIATQEVAKNLKNWERSCYREQKTEKLRRLKEFLMQDDQESRTVSLTWTIGTNWRLKKILYDPDSPSSYDSTYVPHQALTTSSSRKSSREIGMLRNAREDVSIPWNVCDCQHARRDYDELHNNSRNLALRSEGIEKIESEEPLQSTPLPCFSVRARQKV